MIFIHAFATTTTVVCCYITHICGFHVSDIKYKNLVPRFTDMKWFTDHENIIPTWAEHNNH